MINVSTRKNIANLKKEFEVLKRGNDSLLQILDEVELQNLICHAQSLYSLSDVQV